MEKPMFRLTKAKLLPDPDDEKPHSVDNFHDSEPLNLSLKDIVEKQIADIDAADMEQNDEYNDQP